MERENPWRSIWCNPRSTIRGIVEKNPNKSLWLLAFIFGFTSLLNGFQSFPIAIKIGLLPMFALTVIVGAIWGYLIFSLWSWAVLVTGKLLKGKASFREARAAYAWSCVPLLGNVVIWLVLVILFGSMLFFGPQQHSTLTGPTVTILFLLLLAKVVFSIWSIVIYLQALAEVQSFSVLRSIANVILATLFLGLLVALPFFLLTLLVSGGSHTAAMFGLDVQDAYGFIHFYQ